MDITDIMLMGFQQQADAQRRVAAEVGDQFAGLTGVRQSLFRLGLHPVDDGNAAITEDHQGIMGVADHAGQFEFQDPVQQVDGVQGRLLFGGWMEVKRVVSGALQVLVTTQPARTDSPVQQA